MPPPLRRIPEVFVLKSVCLISHYPQFALLRTCITSLYALAAAASTSPSSIVGSQFKVPAGALPDLSGGAAAQHYQHLRGAIVALIRQVPLPKAGLMDIGLRISNVSPLLPVHFSATRGPLQTPGFGLRTLFDCLNVDNVVTVLGVLLCEGRLIFHSASLLKLSAVTQCFAQLLYPLQWWYAYIPVLPSHMLDAHEIPQPYILGRCILRCSSCFDNYMSHHL